MFDDGCLDDLEAERVGHGLRGGTDGLFEPVPGACRPVDRGEAVLVSPILDHRRSEVPCSLSIGFVGTRSFPEQRRHIAGRCRDRGGDVTLQDAV